MFFNSCYGTNKLLLYDFCTFVQINSIQFNSNQTTLMRHQRRMIRTFILTTRCQRPWKTIDSSARK